MNDELLRLYKDARSYKCGEYLSDAPPYSATHALRTARKLLERGEKRYSDAWPWQRGAYNVTRQTDRRDEAWIENTKSAGLRFVGYADEICGRAIDHKGWFTSENGWNGEVLRGAVWQLPARKGIPRFLGGYVDPNNEGAAYVDLEIFEGEKGGEDNDEAKRDAAMRGDGIAERDAEREREYNEAWQAGNEWSELGDEIAETRQETLALLVESRPERRKARETSTPHLCAAVRREIERGVKRIAKLRKRRAELFDNYARHDGFAEFLPEGN